MWLHAMNEEDYKLWWAVSHLSVFQIMLFEIRGKFPSLVIYVCVCVFRGYIYKREIIQCLSFSDLFHIANALTVHPYCHK